MPDVPLSDWPIVVGGCHRSGTSLVRRLLNSHSRIHCGPEVKLFADLYDTGARDPWRLHFVSTAGSLLSSDELLALLGPVLIELHERAAAAAGKVRWADKVPENVVYLPQWHRLLGDRWLFVHVNEGWVLFNVPELGDDASEMLLCTVAITVRAMTMATRFRRIPEIFAIPVKSP